MLPTVVGRLVVMREVLVDDLQQVWEWENNSEMGLYLNADPQKRMSMDEVRRRFQQYRTDPTSGLFIICTLEKRSIGMLGFDRLYKDIGTCRLFIGIGSDEYRGRGYGTDAMRLVLRFFFRDVGMKKVQLSVYDFNSRAMASYRKCGFEVESVRRNIAYVNGAWCDSIEMAVSVDRYAELEPVWEGEWAAARTEWGALERSGSTSAVASA
ncbi:MAG: GNAT family N-acetyltransferase [Chloroflexi bacterium]|nr:GNAT family N-acetyltransferase [Chloroflexota bacterium]